MRVAHTVRAAFKRTKEDRLEKQLGYAGLAGLGSLKGVLREHLAEASTCSTALPTLSLIEAFAEVP